MRKMGTGRLQSWKICLILQLLVTAAWAFAGSPCKQQLFDPILWSCRIIPILFKQTAINSEMQRCTLVNLGRGAHCSNTEGQLPMFLCFFTAQLNNR